MNWNIQVIVLIIIIFCASSIKSTGQKKVYVPDDNFEKLLMEQDIDLENPSIFNDTVIISESSPTKTLYIHNIGGKYLIEDLTGIEAFTGLEKLEIVGQKIKILNLQSNIKLKSLVFSHNQNSMLPNKLDLSTLSNLKELQCIFMGIDSIIFSPVANLIDIEFSFSLIKNFDSTQHPKLESLRCTCSGLKNINVSNNPLLEHLNCVANGLDSLNINRNSLLTSLYCSNNNIKHLDVSKNFALMDIDASSNFLSSIDISKNVKLEILNISNNLITNIDLSKNTMLGSVSADDNLITEIDVSKNYNLISLSCRNNNIEVINLGHNYRFTHLDCRNNKMKCLNLKNGNDKNLSMLYLNNNPELACIQTDNGTISSTTRVEKDAQMYFISSCPCASDMYCMITINQRINSCCSYESPSGKYIWETSGQYLDTLKNSSVCDSIIITNLKIYPPYKPSVNVSGDTLKSDNIYKTYQWYNENGIIPGAIQNKYIINKSGKYYLVITDNNGCTNTSDVTNVVYSGVNYLNNESLKYIIIPNPNTGRFSLRIKKSLEKDVILRLFNPLGEMIDKRSMFSETLDQFEEYNVSNLSKGIYYMIISDEGYQKGEKIIIQ